MILKLRVVNMSMVLIVISILLLSLRYWHRPSGLYIIRPDYIESIGAIMSVNRKTYKAYESDPRTEVDHIAYDNMEMCIYYCEYPNIVKYDVDNDIINIISSINNALTLSNIINDVIAIGQCEFTRTSGASTITLFNIRSQAIIQEIALSKSGIIMNCSTNGEYVAYSIAETMQSTPTISIISLPSGEIVYNTEGKAPEIINNSMMIYEHNNIVYLHDIINSKDDMLENGRNLSVTPDRKAFYCNINDNVSIADGMIYTISNSVINKQLIKLPPITDNMNMQYPFIWSNSSSRLLIISSLDRWNEKNETESILEIICEYDINDSSTNVLYKKRIRDERVGRILGAFLIDNNW